MDITLLTKILDWILLQSPLVIILIGVNYMQYRERTRLLNSVLEAAQYLGTVDRSLQNISQILHIKHGD